MPEIKPTEGQEQPSGQITQLDVDGLLIDLPQGTMVPTLARQIEQARIEAGLTTEKMLADLRSQRAIYVKEKYGIID